MLDPGALRRKRQSLIGDRIFRWRQAAVFDEYGEAISTRRWWSLDELHMSVYYRQYPASFSFAPPEQWYQEFLAALEARIFDVGGKTAIAYLDPSVELAEPWPQLRLTFSRAKQLIDLKHFAPYHWLDGAWIEIDRAFKWLLTWLGPGPVRSWSDLPHISQSLQAAAHHRARQAVAGSKAPQGGRVEAPQSAGGERASTRLQAAVEATIAALGMPGKQVPWKTFCEAVCARCGVPSTERGYGYRTIRRIVNGIEGGPKE